MSISHRYMMPVAPKQVLEAVSYAAAYLPATNQAATYRRILAQIGEAAHAMRPTGPDGKHGDRHTPQCGCMENPLGRYACFWCGGKGFNPLSRGRADGPVNCLKCDGRGWVQG